MAVVGVRRIGHSGALSYFVQQAARAGMVGICQPIRSDGGVPRSTTAPTPSPSPHRAKAMS